MKLKDAEAELAELNKRIALNADDYSRELQLSNAIIKHRGTYFDKLRLEFRSFIDALPEEYDDLHTKNRIEHALKVLADAEEVEI